VYFNIYASGTSRITEKRRYIPTEAIEQIELVATSNEYIVGHALVSVNLLDCLGLGVDNTAVSMEGTVIVESFLTHITLVTNIGRSFASYVNIYAASPNFYDTVFSDFVILASATEKYFDTASNLMNYLYSIPGSTGIIMGTADSDRLNLQVAKNSHLLLNVPTVELSRFKIIH
jgi:hypothetical protein